MEIRKIKKGGSMTEDKERFRFRFRIWDIKRKQMLDLTQNYWRLNSYVR